MPRRALQLEIDRIQGDLLVLGSQVEDALLAAVDALRRRDLDAAKSIIAGDQRINEKRFALESDCLAVIATQQPAAGDLRTLAAVLELATELERIGDYAKGISRISLAIGEAPLIKPLVDIPAMAGKALSMLRRSLDAFVCRDVAMARAIPLEDDQVDALYNRVYKDLLAIIVADPRQTDGATRLLWVAHNLERAADRVTNICERVVFTVTGEMLEMDVRD